MSPARLIKSEKVLEYLFKLIKKEEISKNKVLKLLPPPLLSLKELTLKSQLELKITINKVDTTGKKDQSKEFHKDTLLTEEVELEEKTDPESKVEEEETLVTSETNSTQINMKNPLYKS